MTLPVDVVFTDEEPFGVVLFEDTDFSVTIFGDESDDLTVGPDSEALALLLAPVYRGPPGPPGIGAADYEQTFTNSTGGVMNHNLGRYPKVECRTVGGLRLIVNFQYLNNNQILFGPLSAPMTFIVNVQ